MARAIFKDWFIDFGPTRAKMEGRLASRCQNLFPDFRSRTSTTFSPTGWLTQSLGRSQMELVQ